MDRKVVKKTVNGKLRKWYPFEYQRRRQPVVKLREHMMGCLVCSDPTRVRCTTGSGLLLKADYALGLLEVANG